MNRGDKCWIIENGSKITPVEIISFSGNLVLLKTKDGKALRLPKHRIYESEEKAKEKVQKWDQVQKRRTPYDYMT